MKLIISLSLSLGLWIAAATEAVADQHMLVSKQEFRLAEFTTHAGEKIHDLRIGWEAYGKLNKDKSNVILITHFFTGSSHAAGKYHKDDASPGYWDTIIGPGKAIDTNRFYVISSDTLVNANAHDPNVITTGPASVNPTTGKPYGLDFPVVTVRDFVNVQKALLDSLGIERLYAVAGPSMGSFQAIEWAAAYPDKVARVISAIGSAQTDAWTTVSLHHWAMPIMLDKHWKNGDYYQSSPPRDGLVASLMMITQQALEPAFFNQVLAHQPLQRDTLESVVAEHDIVSWLRHRAEQRADKMDANHILYLVRASQAFTTGFESNLEQGLKRIKAKVLFLPSARDMLLLPENIHATHQQLLSMDKSSKLQELSGGLGHLDGVAGIAQHADAIRQFLTEE